MLIVHRVGGSKTQIAVQTSFVALLWTLKLAVCCFYWRLMVSQAQATSPVLKADIPLRVASAATGCAFSLCSHSWWHLGSLSN